MPGEASRIGTFGQVTDTIMALDMAHEGALRPPRAVRLEGVRPRRAPVEADEDAQGGSLIRLLALPCAALALLAAATVLLVHLKGADIARAGHSVDTRPHEIQIGNDVLSVPANVVRFAGQRRAASAERLDLYFHWPKMEGYSDALGAAFNSAAINPAIVFVTVEPRSMRLDMSGRIEPIYSRFMSGPELQGGYGLVRRSLNAEGGFADEELWYEANSPYPFAARCVKEQAGGGTPYCLRDIQMGRGLAVTYRFHRSLLPRWMALEDAVRGRIRAMLAG